MTKVEDQKLEDFELLSYGMAFLNNEEIVHDFWSDLRSRNVMP